MKNQEIRTTPDEGKFWDWDYSFSGRLRKQSQLTVHNNQTGRRVATLSGYRLYRLAKAIVKRYEHSYIER